MGFWKTKNITMKKLVVSIVMIFCVSVSALSQKYSTKTGEISFEASVPSFEEVKAKNSAVSAILNTETGAMAALVLMKGFRFKVALMEEHFNENYMESEKFPKATLKGSIKDFSVTSLNDSAKKFIMQSEITIHGVTKNMEIPITLQSNGETIEIISKFVLNPDDFNISIPNIVRKKVAENVNVSVHLQLSN